MLFEVATRSFLAALGFSIIILSLCKENYFDGRRRQAAAAHLAARMWEKFHLV